jgi:predicted MFS family arabinose efflux permease
MMSEETPRYRWWVLCMVVLANFLPTGMAWFYIVIMVTNVCQDLGIGLVEFSKLWAGISLGAFLFSLAGGALGDRLGVRKVVGGGMLLMGAALVWRAEASTFGSMFGAMVLFGACIALVAPNLPKALGQWFSPHEFGFANGAALAGNGAGQALALSVGPLLLDPLGGWRAITRLLGLVILGLGLLWIATLRDREGSVGGGGDALSALRAVTTIVPVWILAGAYMLFLGGYIGVIQYLPTYYEKVQGMSKAAAGGMVSLVLFTYIFGSIALPTLSDRLGLRKSVYVPGMLLSAVVAILAATVTGPPLAAVMIAWGLAAGVVAILFVVPLELAGVGPAYAGSALGLALTAGFAGGFVSPVIGSTLASATPLAGIGFWAACYAGSALLFLLLPETGPRARRERAGVPAG